ncbi:MAG: DUF262 domain-containing protein [Candidatus Binatia bacterium]
MLRKPDIFRVTQFEAKTLSWWRARRAKIDMSPPYQRRGKLWSATDKAYLIDSILNGFDVPKIYVADFTWGDSKLNEKRLPYAIIDGKQRFEAIFDFYDGHITLNDGFVYRENPLLKLAGLGYQDLLKNHAEVAEIFDTYNLSVMSVMASSEEPINELFVRLNRSKPLTGAEVRNAMAGPAPQLFRKVTEHEFFTTYVAFTVQRGQDLNAAAKLVMFEYEDNVSETKKRNMDQFTKDAVKAARAKLELAARRVLDTLDVMTEIFLPKDRLLMSAGTVPVYYWFIRSVPVKSQRFIRQFLIEFEEARKPNRLLSSAHPQSPEVDRQLVEFDIFNRSTNDQASHEGRFRILHARFAGYVRNAHSRLR